MLSTQEKEAEHQLCFLLHTTIKSHELSKVNDSNLNIIEKSEILEISEPETQCVTSCTMGPGDDCDCITPTMGP